MSEQFKSPTAWLAGLAGALLLSALGALGTRAVDHTSRISALEVHTQRNIHQLDRIEQKLDRLIRERESREIRERMNQPRHAQPNQTDNQPDKR